VFNVGLPIVIDTCPMPRQAGSMACPFCSEKGWDGHGTAVQGKPCCAPQLAADRNLNDFIRGASPAPTFFAHTVILIPPALSMSPLPVQEFSIEASPPHQLFGDIPVALSTFLI